MKKILAMLLCFSMLLICGCTSNNLENNTDKSKLTTDFIDTTEVDNTVDITNDDNTNEISVPCFDFEPSDIMASLQSGEIEYNRDELEYEIHENKTYWLVYAIHNKIDTDCVKIYIGINELNKVENVKISAVHGYYYGECLNLHMAMVVAGIYNFINPGTYYDEDPFYDSLGLLDIDVVDLSGETETMKWHTYDDDDYKYFNIEPK